MNHKYFRSFEAESESRIIGSTLARHLKEKNIGRIIFMDSSARPTYIALKKSWKKKFPNLETPEIYFTNPQGYNLRERDVEEIAEEFDTTYPKLSRDKETGLMLFDVCVNKGQAMRDITEVLRTSGYSDIRIGLAQPKHLDVENRDVSVDFVSLRDVSWNYCKPFTKDHAIEKSGNLLSARTKNERKSKLARELRKELTSLF